MKNVIKLSLFLGLFLLAPGKANACSHGCGIASPLAIRNAQAVNRVGIGRFPLVPFAAPIRRSLGLPGFTPVRQFLFGRGAIRRQNRRAFLFG